MSNAFLYYLGENEIFVDNSQPLPSPDNVGISLQGCHHTSVNCNIIKGGYRALMNSDNFAVKTVMSPNYHIKCNLTEDIYEGFVFKGNSFSSWYAFESNQLFNHANGLHIDSSGLIGPQFHKGNEWRGLYSHLEAWDENSAGSLHDQFYVNPSTAFHLPDSINPSSGWFYPGGNTDDTCYSYPSTGNCMSYIPEPTEPDPNIFSRIARDEIHSDKYDIENGYLLKRMLMKEILKNPDLVNGDQDIADFYTANLYSNIDILSRVELAFDTLYVASTEFDGVNDLNSLDSILESKMVSIAINDSILLFDSTLTTEEYEDLITANSELRSGIAAISESITDIHETVQSLINARIPGIQALLASTAGNTIYEENEMAVRNIYMNTIAVGIIPDSSTYASTLYSIASQCPFRGGPAVFAARPLYKFIDPSQTYDDDRKCASPDTCLVPERPSLMQFTNGLNNMGLCGVELDISTASSVEQYLWTIPQNEQINVIYNPGEYAVYLGFGSEFTYGEICVQGINECGIGPSKCVVVYGRPAPIEGLSGNFIPCPESTESYSWDPVPGAIEYTVFSTTDVSAYIVNTMPTTDRSVEIVWADSISSSTVGIFASNQCGNSDTVYIPAFDCNNSQARIKSNTFSKSIITGDIKLFPNPTSGKVKMISKINNEKGKLLLVNMLGVVVKSFTLEGNSNNFEFDISSLSESIIEWRVFDKDNLAGRGSLVIMK